MSEQSLEQSERLAREAALNRQERGAETEQPQKQTPEPESAVEGGIRAVREAVEHLPLTHDEVHPDLPLPVEIPESQRPRKLEEMIASGEEVEIDPNKKKGMHAHEAMEQVIRRLEEKS
ncbi:MAG TPA: hypothetical protein VGQ87_01660 [Patescibacteria group bacterium]|jgi:hypothetical protein|nr:hypothetical protein [Patescibacteria group bacterium]